MKSILFPADGLMKFDDRLATSPEIGEGSLLPVIGGGDGVGFLDRSITELESLEALHHGFSPGDRIDGRGGVVHFMDGFFDTILGFDHLDPEFAFAFEQEGEIDASLDLLDFPDERGGFIGGDVDHGLGLG